MPDEPQDSQSKNASKLVSPPTISTGPYTASPPIPQRVQVPTSERAKRITVYCAVASEVLFVLLPFLVIAIVFIHSGQFGRLIYMPEWALAAAVLIGQGIARLISGLLLVGVEASYSDRAVFIISGIIVLFLVPSLIVLTFVLTTDAMSKNLAVVQLGSFICALVLFTLVAYAVRSETL